MDRNGEEKKRGQIEAKEAESERASVIFLLDAIHLPATFNPLAATNISSGKHCGWKITMSFFFSPLVATILTFSGDDLSSILSLCENEPSSLD